MCSFVLASHSMQKQLALCIVFFSSALSYVLCILSHLHTFFPSWLFNFLFKVPVLKPTDLMVEVRPRRVFANGHTYHINSISVNSDGETYLSADDLRINMWHLDITDRSFSILCTLGLFYDLSKLLQNDCSNLIYQVTTKNCYWFLWKWSQIFIWHFISHWRRDKYLTLIFRIYQCISFPFGQAKSVQQMCLNYSNQLILFNPPVRSSGKPQPKSQSDSDEGVSCQTVSLRNDTHKKPCKSAHGVRTLSLKTTGRY